MNLIFTLIFLFIIGLCSALVAKAQRRSPILWFFIGFCFGLVGFIILLLLPLFARLLSRSKGHKFQKPDSKTSSSINNEDPATIENWYYLDKMHNTLGPVDRSELLKLWSLGQLSAHSYVWQKGMENWKKIEALPHLIQALDEPL